MAAVKIEGTLKSALAKLAHDPTALLDLVVTVAEETGDSTELERHVIDQGGETVRVEPDHVRLRLPVGKIQELADSGLVSTLRMARLRRMH